MNVVISEFYVLIVNLSAGILGPWILSNKSLSFDTYPPIKLTSRRTLLEFVDEGLYLVYIQVVYIFLPVYIILINPNKSVFVLIAFFFK